MIKNKKTYFVILLFITSFYVNNNNFKYNNYNNNEINNNETNINSNISNINNDNIISNNNETNYILDTKNKKSIDYSTTYIAPTAHIEHNFPRVVPNEEDISGYITGDDYSGEIYFYGTGALLYGENDGSGANDGIGVESEIILNSGGYCYFFVTIPFEIELSGLTPDTLYIEYKDFYSDDEWYARLWLNKNDGEQTQFINELMSQNEIYSTNIQVSTDYIINGKISGVVVFYSSASSASNVEYDMQLSELALTFDNIEENLKGTYQYTSYNTKLFTYNVYSLYDYDTIKIYYPDNLDFSSITPKATIVEYSDYIEILKTTEGAIYIINFISTNNYFLAIEDITSDYLQDIGFETGTYIHDYSSTCQAPTSISIATDIVSEGGFSLKFEDTEDVYTETFNYEISYRGHLYVSFDYYIDSSTTNLDNFGIIYRINDSTWSNRYVSDPTVRDRWCKFFTHFDLLGDEAVNNRNLAIYFQNFKGLAYIDNVRFYITSTEIKTTSSNQYEITGQFVSWDGYQNPVLPNKEVNKQNMKLMILQTGMELI